MHNHKNLLASDQDLQWGLTITTTGYEEYGPCEPYPTHGHADGYYFDPQKGRTLQEYQIIYIVEGDGEFQSTSQPLTRLYEGDICLLFPGEWHTFHPGARGWKRYNIGFRGAVMDRRVQAGFLSPAKPIYHVGFSDSMVRLYNKALEVSVKEEAHSQQVLAGVVELLIGLMYAKERNIELKSRDQSHVDMVNRARLMIRDHLESTLTIQEVASRLGVSYSSFRRLFKEHTGLSPATYQQDLRLQRAKELLTTTDLSIKEIAYRLNFDSPDYFSAKFKNATGRRPSDMRG